MEISVRQFSDAEIRGLIAQCTKTISLSSVSRITGVTTAIKLQLDNLKPYLTVCILYCVQKKLKWAISDFAEEQAISSVYRIRVLYTQLQLGLLSENDFSLLTVLVVKLVGHFIRENVSFLDVNTALEAQLCITYLHAVLGIQVGTHLFRLLEAKHCRKPKVDRISCHQTASPCPRSSIAMHGLNATVKCFSKLKDGSSGFRRPSAKPMQTQPSSSDFSAELKRSLHVDPLPPLIEKKKSIHELDELYEKNLSTILKKQNQLPDENVTNNYAGQTRMLNSKQYSISLQVKLMEMKNPIYYSPNNTVHFHTQLQNKNPCFVKEAERAQTGQINAHVEQGRLQQHHSIKPTEWIKIVNKMKGSSKLTLNMEHRKKRENGVDRLIENSGKHTNFKVSSEELSNVMCPSTQTDKKWFTTKNRTVLTEPYTKLDPYSENVPKVDKISSSNVGKGSLPFEGAQLNNAVQSDSLQVVFNLVRRNSMINLRNSNCDERVLTPSTIKKERKAFELKCLNRHQHLFRSTFTKRGQHMHSSNDHRVGSIK